MYISNIIVSKTSTSARNAVSGQWSPIQVSAHFSSRPIYESTAAIQSKAHNPYPAPAPMGFKPGSPGAIFSIMVTSLTFITY